MELSEKDLAETMKFIEEMEDRENEKLRTLEKDLKNNSFILSSIEKLIDSDTKIVYSDSDTIFTSDEFDRLFSALDLITNLTGTSYEDLSKYFPTYFAVILFKNYLIKLETMYGQGTMYSIKVELVDESDFPKETLKNSKSLEFLLKYGLYLFENKSVIREKREILLELNSNLSSMEELLKSHYISSESKYYLLTAIESLKESIEINEKELELE